MKPKNTSVASGTIKKSSPNGKTTKTKSDVFPNIDGFDQSKKQLDLILQNVADGITVQSSTGTLMYVNKAAAQMSGYSSVEDMLQNPRKWVEYFTLWDIEGNKLSFVDLPGRKALSGEESEMVIRFYNVKDDTTRWSLVKARPVKDNKGTVQMVIYVVRDVTEQMENEERKDEFISLASHELKTPITSMKIYTQVLKNQMIKNNDRKSLITLRKIEEQVDNQTKLVGELLDLSRIQVGKMDYNDRVFNISSLIRESARHIGNTTDKHTISVTSSGRQFVKADKDRIEQVIINLLTNAVKYSPEGGKILVHVKNHDKNSVIIAVKDQGIGIPKTKQEKIFKRFYQGGNSKERSYPGLGIGLYIASEIVRRHKGKLWVESNGKGSTFFVTLPKNNTASKQMSARQKTSQSSHS